MNRSQWRQQCRTERKVRWVDACHHSGCHPSSHALGFPGGQLGDGQLAHGAGLAQRRQDDRLDRSADPRHPRAVSSGKGRVQPHVSRPFPFHTTRARATRAMTTARGMARVAETDVAGAMFSAAVSRRAVTVWNIASVCTGLIACMVLFGLRLVFHEGWLAIVLTVLVGVTVASTVTECLLVNPRRALTFRYGVEPMGLSIGQGRWIQRETFVPRAQILYVRLRRGPVLRNFRLASVHVGVLGREFMVPCLDDRDAERLRGALKNVDRAAE